MAYFSYLDSVYIQCHIYGTHKIYSKIKLLEKLSCFYIKIYKPNLHIQMNGIRVYIISRCWTK